MLQREQLLIGFMCLRGSKCYPLAPTVGWKLSYDKRQLGSRWELAGDQVRVKWGMGVCYFIVASVLLH